MKRSNLLKLDKFGSRWDVQKYAIESEVGYVGVMVAVLSCLLDFANVFSRYDKINEPTSKIMLLAMTIATVIALDVPMYISGCVLKSYMQKEKNKAETVIIISGSVAVFLTLAVLNLLLSVELGPFMLEDPALNSGDLFSDAEPTNSVLIGSWILGLLAVLTSIASFVVGIYTSNPLLHRVNKLKKALNQIYAFVSKAKQALAEVFYHDPQLAVISRDLYELINKTLNSDPNDVEYQNELASEWIKLSERVDDSYVNSSLFKHACEKHYKNIAIIYSEELTREQHTLEAIQKKLDNPDDISIVSADAIALAEKHSQEHPVA